jgi:hypothetical protein
MADREQPYDPYIPAGGAGGQAGAQGQNGNHRTQALQEVCLLLFSVDIAQMQSFAQCYVTFMVLRCAGRTWSDLACASCALELPEPNHTALLLQCFHSVLTAL